MRLRRHQVRAALLPLVSAGALVWNVNANGQSPPRPVRDPVPSRPGSNAVPASIPEAPDDEPLTTLREGFESARTSWRQEEADVTVNLLTHDRSEAQRHDGRRAEHFRFESQGLGNSVYYSLPLPRAPIFDDTEVSLYVHATQPGIQLLAKVILPNDVDLDTGQPAFVSVSGGSYDNVNRWQRLELTDLRQAVERQARILRVQSRRKVRLDGAYIERLVVNLYGGGGESEVYLDDLTITPVPESAALAFQGGGTEPKPERVATNPAEAEMAAGSAAAPNPSPPTAVEGSGTSVRLEGTRLTRNGRAVGPHHPRCARRLPGPGPAVWLRRGDGRSLRRRRPGGHPTRRRDGALLVPDLRAVRGPAARRPTMRGRR